MKSAGQPDEMASGDYASLADQFLQENEYLPARGDHSWREKAALGISGVPEAGALEEGDGSDGDDALDMVPLREGPGSDLDIGDARRGRILIPILMAAIIVPVVAVLTVPGILTLRFWRGQQTETHIAAVPPSPPAGRTNIPAPAPASPAKAPPPQPAKVDRGQDVSAQPVTNPPEMAPVPKVRSTGRTTDARAGENGGAARFRSLVIGPDGALRYEYFSSEPTAKGVEREQSEGDSGNGFYAMVPDPDGTLRYRYFPSKPAR